MWTMIKDLGSVGYGNQGLKRRKAIYKCSCGVTKTLGVSDVKSGKSLQCKTCTNREKSIELSTHNSCDTRLYKVWSNMKARCYTPSSTFYDNYGGRGIKVCGKWLNSFEKFQKWALKNGYSDELTIDRKHSDGNYKPSNCRWASNAIQVSNKRDTLWFKFGVDVLSDACEFYQNTNITQKELASLMGVCSATISNLVTDKHNYTPK